MGVIDKSVIQPGDLLLHRGNGQISALIAWAGDSPFSHAAMVYDDAQVVEAGVVGVHRSSLLDRVVDTADFLRIDAYRPSRALTADELAAVRAVADGYMGRPYPLNELVHLAVICALRDKLPRDDKVRLLLREVTDHMIDNDTKFEVCSELVYRCFAEARVTPSLAPEIVILDWVDTPFPQIDWLKLIEEFNADKERARNAGNPAQPHLLPSPSFATGQVVTDEELLDNHARLRDMLGAPPPGSVPNAGAESGGPIVDPAPNPRAILPADLANSPNFTHLGTVLPAA